MTTYNLKRDTAVYVVINGLKYRIDVYPDLSATQTFDETAVPVKTLHSQFKVFEGAVINRANPANFNFTMPVLLEDDLNIVLSLLLDWKSSTEATLSTADLYLDTGNEVFKVEKAVFENGVFQMGKNEIVSIALSGSGRKLSRFIGSIPGTLVPRASTRTFSSTNAFSVFLNGESQSSVISATVEITNEVSWTDFATIQAALSNASDTTQYPEAFVVSGRRLSGNIQQYVTSDHNNVNSWSVTTSLEIMVGNEGQDPTLHFNIPSVVFTNGLRIEDFYVQSYDFRMNSNPETLSDVIIKRNI